MVPAAGCRAVWSPRDGLMYTLTPVIADGTALAHQADMLASLHGWTAGWRRGLQRLVQNSYLASTIFQGLQPANPHH
jgi:hypothetical protein